MTVDSKELAYIVEEVCRRMGTVSTVSTAGGGAHDGVSSVARAAAPGIVQGCGIYPDIPSAVEAAKRAQRALIELGTEKRREIVAAMRVAAIAEADTVGRMAVEETGLGRMPDKAAKIRLSASKTPGPETLETLAVSGEHGLVLTEFAPFGVIGAITPSTNPAETVINNGIAMISGGNAVVFNCHPSAKNTSRYTVELLNKAIMKAGGPADLLCVLPEPTKESSDALMHHPDIRLLAVTGGPEIVRIAMNSGKKAICAGPGNPPVVVDETADIERAAKCIVDGASFDNNVLCFAEKETICVDSVCDRLLDAMGRCGGYRLSAAQGKALSEAVLVRDKEGGWSANKKFVGKDASVLLRAIGIEAPSSVRLVYFEAEKDSPLVFAEQLMPFMPVVRCRDAAEAIEFAVKAEGGCHHTAMMHSRNIDNLTAMARAVDTTIFVKNGPSYAGLGYGGEGYTTFTIATPTGEGVTTPLSFTRRRRCVLTDSFRII